MLGKTEAVHTIRAKERREVVIAEFSVNGSRLTCKRLAADFLGLALISFWPKMGSANRRAYGMREELLRKPYKIWLFGNTK
jgi:hypothetical protein